MRGSLHYALARFGRDDGDVQVAGFGRSLLWHGCDDASGELGGGGGDGVCGGRRGAGATGRGRGSQADCDVRDRVDVSVGGPGANYRANLNGWFVRGTVNLARGYGVFFSSTNYYGTNAKGSVNSHGYTMGVTKEVLARARVKCSVFGEAGDVRASSAGTITNELLIATGVGVTIPVSRWVSVVVTPAEYVFVYPHGDWRNDYNGKLGLSFPIGRR